MTELVIRRGLRAGNTGEDFVPPQAQSSGNNRKAEGRSMLVSDF